MKISFLCKYQGKVNGFVNVILNQNDYTLSLYQRAGMEYNLVEHGCGPQLSLFLFTNEEGKLECAIRGLGRKTNLSTSPWNIGDEKKFATMVFCEENESDRSSILALAGAFVSNYYAYGNKVLDSVIPAPEIEYIELEISKEKFSTFLKDVPNAKKYTLLGPLKPNRLIYYYSPVGLVGATFEKLFNFFVGYNIEKLSKKVFCFDKTKAKEVFEKSLVDFQFACKNEDKPLPIKVGNIVVKSVFDLAGKIKSVCTNKTEDEE